MFRWASVCFVAIGFWSAAALAATEVDRSCDVSPDVRVVVKNVAGLVQIQPWDQNRVELKGTLGEDVTRLDFNGGGQLVTAEVVVPQRHGRRIASNLVLSVPAGASVDVDAVSADVRVNGVAGGVNASTVSGDLLLEKVAGTVRATSVSGDVDVFAGAPSVTARTTSGKVEVSGEIEVIQADSVSGPVDVSGTAQSVSSETISGNITVKGTVGEFKGKTVSGDMTVNRANDKADASTVSGDIKVDAGRFSWGNLSTESGDIEFSGELAETGRLNAVARSGSILLRVPESPAFAFDASTLSGDIRNAFGPAPEKPVGAGSRLRFGPAGASASVSLETLSGSIVLERK